MANNEEPHPGARTHGLDLNMLDPLIWKLVRYLRECRFMTTDSGDGVTKVEQGIEGALDVPHIHMPVPSAIAISEAHRLADELKRAGVILGPGTIQLSYDPVDGIAVLSVYGVLDQHLHHDYK